MYNVRIINSRESGSSKVSIYCDEMLLSLEGGQEWTLKGLEKDDVIWIGVTDEFDANFIVGGALGWEETLRVSGAGISATSEVNFVQGFEFGIWHGVLMGGFILILAILRKLR